MSLFTKSSDKEKEKKNKKVLLLNKEKSEKGDEDSAFEW